jgi:hypothetical protein
LNGANWQALIFNGPGKLSQRALGRILKRLEKPTPMKAVMTAQLLNSSFLKRIVKEAKTKGGTLTNIVS